jgi:hypothetical protein
MIILNEKNTIFTQEGVDKKELLREDQAIIYRSPSKISTMGYAGKAERIYESTTIPQEYCDELSRMKGFISLGSTGTGDSKEYKNVHLYSESAEYLDGIYRIAYLFHEGDKLKICEYKKGTRGSRYSSLYEILKDKLLKAGFANESDCFSIDISNVTAFVDIISKINDEQNQGKYELIKSKEVDELSSGVFNVAYWMYKGERHIETKQDKVEKLFSISEDLINKIDSCSDINTLIQLDEELSTVHGFCKSKIEALKLIQRKE